MGLSRGFTVAAAAGYRGAHPPRSPSATGLEHGGVPVPPGAVFLQVRCDRGALRGAADGGSRQCALGAGPGTIAARVAAAAVAAVAWGNGVHAREPQKHAPRVAAAGNH